MIGMSLLSFLVLTLIAVVVAAVMHYGVRYRFLDGMDAFFGKAALAWLGAWLGSPVFGHWLWNVENVYIVPAILGAGVPFMLIVLSEKAVMKMLAGRPPEAISAGAGRKAA